MTMQSISEIGLNSVATKTMKSSPTRNDGEKTEKTHLS